jgi:hypothetical protein
MPISRPISVELHEPFTITESIENSVDILKKKALFARTNMRLGYLALPEGASFGSNTLCSLSHSGLGFEDR